MEIYLKIDPNYKRYVQEESSFQVLDQQPFIEQNFNNNNNDNKVLIKNSKLKFQQTTTNQSKENICQQYFQKIQLAYRQHRIDQAYQQGQKYLQYLKSENISINNDKHKLLLAKIQEEMQDLRMYEKQLQPDGWVHKNDGKNYRLYTKQFSSTIAALIEGQIQVPIENFLFVANQIDLMKNFMPFMILSEQTKTVARNNKIGHVVTDFPVLSKRQAFFQGVGYDRLSHNQTILLYSRSLHNRPDLQQKLDYKVHTDPDAVQLEYKFLMIQYKPTDKTKGLLRMATNVDMKLSLPNFILDPIVQNFSKDFLKNLLKVTNNFKGSEWQKRLSQKTEFANFIRRIINKHFPN